MPNNLLTFGGLSGTTYYAVIVSQSLQFASAATLENYNGAHWTSGNYCNLFTAAGGPGTIFSLTFPALPAGQYDVFIFTRVGGSPATTDTVADGWLVTWDGTNITSVVSSYTAPATAAAIAAALQTLGAISFTIVSPIMENGALTLVAGDDYFNADQRAITFSASAGVWPNLTSASVVLKGKLSPSCPNAGSASYSVTGVVSQAGTGQQTIYFEPASAVTSLLAIGAMAYDFAAVATLTDGHVVTLQQGTLTVKAQS